MSRILWICILSFCALCSKLPAQTPITIKHNFLYVDVGVEHHGKKHVVPAMIDTGSSYCLLDSTFAVDSCGISITDDSTTIGNTAGKRVKSYKCTLDSIVFCNVPYHQVRCYIIDLAGKFKGTAPHLIIGGDILKRELWQFDLKDSLITKAQHPLKNSKRKLAWENHKNYAHVFLNSIFLRGKRAGTIRGKGIRERIGGK